MQSQLLLYQSRRGILEVIIVGYVNTFIECWFNSFYQKHFESQYIRWLNSNHVVMKLMKLMLLQKEIEKDTNSVMTSPLMAIDLSALIPFQEGDVVMEPCKGTGSFYV